MTVILEFLARNRLKDREPAMIRKSVFKEEFASMTFSPSMLAEVNRRT